jgi:hydroxymethylglutaryl-CoA synthase
MFSFKVRGSTKEFAEKMNIHKRLESRRVVPPEVYDEVGFSQLVKIRRKILTQLQMCNLREKAHLKKSYTPTGATDTLFPGTYYLTNIDDMFRRTYAVAQ